MGVFTSEGDYVCPIPPSKLYNAIFIDVHTLLPQALPYIIQGAEIVEGDGGPGTIKKITLSEGLGYVKHQVDEVDKANYVYKYSIIEGSSFVLTEPVEKISYEHKLVAHPDGGSLIKSVTKYYTKGDEKLTDEFVNGGNERSQMFMKAIEDYILANPDYNN